MPSWESVSIYEPLGLLLCLAAFLIGLSKGGLPGIGMLSVPLAALVMSPVKAAILLLPIYILSDVVGVWLYRREYSLDNLKVLIPAGITGVMIGWSTASMVSDDFVSMLIGFLGVGFCLHQWFRVPANQPPVAPSKARGFAWGALSGFTSFVSHAGAPPYQIYVLPQQLPKMVFAGTTTIVFAAVNLAKIVPYSSLNPYTRDILLLSASLLPIAAFGTYVGKRSVILLSEKRFFFLVQLALFIICVKLLIDSFWST